MQNLPLQLNVFSNYFDLSVAMIRWAIPPGPRAAPDCLPCACLIGHI